MFIAQTTLGSYQLCLGSIQLPRGCGRARIGGRVQRRHVLQQLRPQLVVLEHLPVLHRARLGLQQRVLPVKRYYSLHEAITLKPARLGFTTNSPASHNTEAANLACVAHSIRSVRLHCTAPRCPVLVPADMAGMMGRGKTSHTAEAAEVCQTTSAKVRIQLHQEAKQGDTLMRSVWPLKRTESFMRAVRA